MYISRILVVHTCVEGARVFIIWIPFLVYITLFLVNALSLKPAKDFSWPININRRDMEHLDVCIPDFKVKFAFSNEIEAVHCMLMYGRSLSNLSMKTIRLRGGTGSEPNTDSKFNEIPYLSKMNFMWNGLPCLDFDEKVLNILNNGLGSINIKSGTLLATVRRTDPGGILGNPPRAAAPPDVVAESDQRNLKAFCCILNYMDPRCELYKMFMRDFNCNGIAVYSVIIAVGPLPIPPRIIRAREDAWSRMTMDLLRFPYTIAGFFSWGEVVSAHGRKLGKDGTQQRDKFVEGLPSFFDAEKSNMRHDMRFVYPALWGGIPGYAGSPIAANAHPLAGEPDHNRMARAYVADWVTKSSSIRKSIPHGMVREIELLPEPDEVVELLAKDVSAKTTCYVCGGEGHSASCVMPNGEKLVCPTKMLQNISGGTKHKNFKQTSTKDDNMAHELHELQTRMDDILRLQQTAQQSERRRFTKPHSSSSRSTAHSLESDAETPDGSVVGESDAMAASGDDDDNDSVDSDGSRIQDFAEVVNPSKSTLRRKPSYPKRR